VPLIRRVSQDEGRRGDDDQARPAPDVERRRDAKVHDERRPGVSHEEGAEPVAHDGKTGDQTPLVREPAYEGGDRRHVTEPSAEPSHETIGHHEQFDALQLVCEASQKNAGAEQGAAGQCDDPWT